MRELTFKEIAYVSGAETLDVTVIDPVAAIQTFLLLMSVTDRDGFQYGSVITGMTAGAVGGGMLGFTSVGGGLAGCALGLTGAGAGLIVGGLAFKAAANFAIGAYNMIM